jgi:hypothetical protein
MVIWYVSPFPYTPYQESTMKRFLTGVFAATLCFAPGFIASARAENLATEAAEHPRIASAIREIEEAIKYMEAAPHNFGGHKAGAIQASKAAIAQLTKALAFRAVQDTKAGKR